MISSSNRPLPILIGSHRALDFLNSIASPRGTPIEWIETGTDLVDWLCTAGLIETRRRRQLLQLDAVVLDRAAADARRLREWFRKLAKAHARKALPPLSSARLRPLNAALAAECVTRSVRIVGDDAKGEAPSSRQVLVSTAEIRTPDQLVAVAAAEIADFICRADFSHVRFCEGHECTVAFYDSSRNHRRRWCNMAICGNRAKQERLRLNARQTRP